MCYHTEKAIVFAIGQKVHLQQPMAPMGANLGVMKKIGLDYRFLAMFYNNEKGWVIQKTVMDKDMK